ncbi:SGNH hydrolase [Eremomyces bilateralis CBS 781.70]|uniref:SGNH hydrolase n=1 Tax=Eremomyces bilateralis CBS 781.70 TaxID=1392243 RepID=A0A6G1FVE5_9PEZI|nr:SGNH hydrolase [Eremomyces bilateralis CBS 781.70]KAF1809652.1 SGNH hydrolase [Eremomyces bilateralis CBS 781.70]
MGIWVVGAIALQILGATALQLASLGSSFAAGPGLPEGGNYAHIFASRLAANLTDLSVSGSTLLNINSQIAGIPGDADLITVTSGGNDLGYVGGLTKDSDGGHAADPSISEQTLVNRFNSALTQIHTQAPSAKIYLVEYLTILGPDVTPLSKDVPFNAERVEHHRGVAATLQRATAQAAEGKAWVERIPVAQASQRNGVGSAIPWINGNPGSTTNGAAWHPTAAGMNAVANMLYEKARQRPE